MIILIAESKTMLTAETEIAPQTYNEHMPVFEPVADEIMGALKGVPIDELAEMTKLSPTLASRLQKAAYDFSFKATGNAAIEAYTGVVFKALDYATLDETSRRRCGESVRIISSLYGWLRPEDVVKTYRLDFTTRLEEGPSEGKAMNSFWRPDVTKAIVRMVQEKNESEILSLLPGDAANCIDWKLVKRFAKVWKADFREMREEDTTRTPAAGRLKTLRGMLLRQILTEGIENIRQLAQTASPHYFCEGNTVYSDHLNFLC